MPIQLVSPITLSAPSILSRIEIASGDLDFELSQLNLLVVFYNDSGVEVGRRELIFGPEELTIWLKDPIIELYRQSLLELAKNKLVEHNIISSADAEVAQIT